jgi:hypothetical protein
MAKPKQEQFRRELLKLIKKLRSGRTWHDPITAGEFGEIFAEVMCQLGYNAGVVAGESKRMAAKAGK